MAYHDILQIYGYIGLYGEILYEMGNIKPHHKPLFKLYAECSRTHVFLSIDTTVVKHDNSLGVFKTGLDASGLWLLAPKLASLFPFDSPESLQATTNTKHSAHLNVSILIWFQTSCSQCLGQQQKTEAATLKGNLAAAPQPSGQ